ncbi:hypothetical protein NCS57_00828700 [Fusarium keratoplasticum]|uniref:Uncharacterized protein n=1 Tax=Fusarium keratoplasticum TaxID=1328300 RepID=A0ACC0QTF4_9HYPO|nr:hypothetical protein NCS57_00828700 [Fusarium keratoplasticum]KAI8666052.1 hypothetical protein NCS57_00828700 [Fusarium keratoplasticum]
MEPKKQPGALLRSVSRIFRRKRKEDDPNSDNKNGEASSSAPANVVFDRPAHIRISEFMSVIPLTAEVTYIEPIHWVDYEPRGMYPNSIMTRHLAEIAQEVRLELQKDVNHGDTWTQSQGWALCNNVELVKHDLGHCKYTMLLDNKLHLSPLPKYPKTILDLGTGTGIWAVDMAELYPSARIIGVDLFPLQTKIVPPNVRFKIDNVEVEWRWGESIFDFIHARELTMTIYDWPNLVQEVYRALKPGAYFEISGFIPDFRSDDGTLPKDSAYVKEPIRWKRYLEEAGFDNVVERALKLPMGPWPSNPHLQKIGNFELLNWRDQAMTTFRNMCQNALGGDQTYYREILAQAETEVLNPNMHSYMPFYVVYGRKPLDAKPCGPRPEKPPVAREKV